MKYNLRIFGTENTLINQFIELIMKHTISKLIVWDIDRSMMEWIVCVSARILEHTNPVNTENYQIQMHNMFIHILNDFHQCSHKMK